MEIPTPHELKQKIPLSSKESQFIAESRIAISHLLERKDPRLLCIVGPCSIHNVEEALVYADRLKTLSEKLQDSCLLVMRAYIEKPRTRSGWKGLAFDPHLNGSEDLSCGLEIARSFLVELAKKEIPAATEFLTPHLTPYIEDAISWGCIGARTTSSQTHRLLASYLPMPIGFKNTVDGNVDCAINGISFARQPHTLLHTDEEGRVKKMKSKGNPHTHVVLRGSLGSTNYDSQSIEETLEKLRHDELPPRLLVDCSHGNCEKNYAGQKKVFESVLKQFQEGNSHILGMMLESNLEAGSQKIPAQLSEMQPGVSITDPCLDFASTAELISLTSMSSLASKIQR